MMKRYIVFASVFLLGGCLTAGADLPPPETPQSWSARAAEREAVTMVEADALRGWWKRFEDEALDELVDLALSDSPDRLMAEARIAEARGLRKSSRSALFPEIGFSSSAGREDTGSSSVDYPDSFYEVGFDASFEIDVFGRNRKALSAADAQLLAAEEQYHDVSLTLVAEVVRTYIDFRAAQSQVRIAQKNLVSQEKTLKLVSDLHRLGAAPRLDVERALNLVSTTRASLPEFERQADNARLRLSVLTGTLPKGLEPFLAREAQIPGAMVVPVLMAPAEVLALRPDIRAAAANLAARTSLRDVAVTELFPSVSLSGFYGIEEHALNGFVSPWNMAIGAAVSLLNFGRIEGQIDAAEARERQAYELYRKTVLQAVSEVETALSDYAHIYEKHVSLGYAYQSAFKAFELSEVLYKEGEVSFLDVLDAQRRVNDAESALVSVKAAYAESITRLFKSLGVY